jgi:hypothetical protein
MEGLVRLVRPEDDDTYFNRPELLEPIFALVLTEPDQPYLMRIVPEKTGIRSTTLYS